MTKIAFLAAYRADLLQRYEWARDAAKLHRFFESVEQTINGGPATWNFSGESVTAAWKAIGGKGKPTLKGLRALAD